MGATDPLIAALEEIAASLEHDATDTGRKSAGEYYKGLSAAFGDAAAQIRQALAQHAAKAGDGGDCWRSTAEDASKIAPVLLLVDGVIHEAIYQGPSDGAIYSGSGSIYNWFSTSAQQSIPDEAIEGWLPLPFAAHKAKETGDG